MYVGTIIDQCVFYITLLWFKFCISTSLKDLKLYTRYKKFIHLSTNDNKFVITNIFYEGGLDVFLHRHVIWF